jgi:hypothetical protein
MTDQYDAGDPTQYKKRKTKTQLKREQELEELKLVMSSPQGRSFLWRLLAQTGLYDELFTGNSTTFYKCGRQSIGRWVLSELTEADKRAYITMQLEALNRDEEDKHGGE